MFGNWLKEHAFTEKPPRSFGAFAQNRKVLTCATCRTPHLRATNHCRQSLTTKNMSKTTKQTTAPVTKLAYTRDEAAAQLGVHPITISRLTDRGELKANRATRRPPCHQRQGEFGGFYAIKSARPRSGVIPKARGETRFGIAAAARAKDQTQAVELRTHPHPSIIVCNGTASKPWLTYSFCTRAQ